MARLEPKISVSASPLVHGPMIRLTHLAGGGVAARKSAGLCDWDPTHPRRASDTTGERVHWTRAWAWRGEADRGPRHPGVPETGTTITVVGGGG
jgi:hypothetical protein